MTREEALYKVEVLQEKLQSSLARGMDEIAAALDKDDLTEVRRVVAAANSLSHELRDAALEIMNELEKEDHEEATKEKEL